MTDTVFLTLLHMSLVGTAIGCIVLAVKWILQKVGVPRAVLLWLWLVVAFRLVCPVTAESELSAFNVVEHKSSVLLAIKPLEQAIHAETESITLQSNRGILTLLWVSGVALMLGKGVFDYLHLKRKLRFAVKKDGYFCAEVPTSFVFGIVKPKIYIPHNESCAFLPYILRHEQMHIRRRDPLFKLIAYAVLTLHWFNPAVWIFCRIFETDTEHACDACAIKGLSGSETKAYLMALVSGAEQKIHKGIQPICFGVCSVKKRVNLLLKRQNRSKIWTSTGIVVVFAVSVTLGTNAVSAKLQVPSVEQAIRQLEEVSVTSTVQNAEPPNTVLPEPQEKKDVLSEMPQTTYVWEPTPRTAVFSYKDNCVSVMEAVEPDLNGEIAMQFSLNTQQYVQISFYESESGEKIEGMGVVAQAGTEYVFSGFETDKTYTVKVDGYTDDTWMIEGTYTIY